MTQPTPQDDPFDSILTLEDTLYTTAHTLGTQDGARTGRIEGRVFGLEKGFDKFSSLGQIHGRSAVWAARLPSIQSHSSTCTCTCTCNPPPDSTTSTPSSPPAAAHAGPIALPPLRETERLKNNITLTHALTDPWTFSTSNTEDGVADFDDRVRRAGAKVKVIERMVGEVGQGTGTGSHTGKDSVAATETETAQDATLLVKKSPVRVSGTAKKKIQKGEESIEDFAGSKLLR
ncbi:hypothetical protein ACN47E_003567 [Coniothyrium glycines]